MPLSKHQIVKAIKSFNYNQKVYRGAFAKHPEYHRISINALLEYEQLDTDGSHNDIISKLADHLIKELTDANS
jgi:hypothetical protein